MSRPPRIYLSAGEPSGDDHAAAVAAALRRRLPNVELEAFGGPRLEAAGVLQSPRHVALMRVRLMKVRGMRIR